MKNPIAELRTTTGYTVEQLSLVSGLTQSEIEKLESGEDADPVKFARLLATARSKQG